MEEPKPGERYMHFRGQDKVYEIFAVARDKENPDKLWVICQSLYDDKTFPKGTIWVHSLEDFFGSVEINGNKIKRFTKIN